MSQIEYYYPGEVGRAIEGLPDELRLGVMAKLEEEYVARMTREYEEEQLGIYAGLGACVRRTSSKNASDSGIEGWYSELEQVSIETLQSLGEVRTAEVELTPLQKAARDVATLQSCMLRIQSGDEALSGLYERADVKAFIFDTIETARQPFVQPDEPYTPMQDWSDFNRIQRNGAHLLFRDAIATSQVKLFEELEAAGVVVLELNEDGLFDSEREEDSYNEGEQQEVEEA